MRTVISHLDRVFINFFFIASVKNFIKKLQLPVSHSQPIHFTFSFPLNRKRPKFLYLKLNIKMYKKFDVAILEI